MKLRRSKSMTQPELPQAVTIDADSSWLLPFVVLIVLGLLITAYRFCIIQTVLQNGRVVSQCRWPLNDLLATDAKSIFRRTDASGASMRPQVKSILSQVYNGQEIAFGVLVYCWGVCLAALAIMQLGDASLLLSPAHTSLCVVLGVAAMIWGVFTVIRRKRNNPFTDKELIL
ncbi:MAG: hypothetical protein ACJAY2_000744 [Pseudomonadales bacterium]|jgi:hypothetical protein